MWLCISQQMPRGGATWEDLLNPNIIGTYNVFEASRRAGVKRVIYASSGSTVSNCERDFPYGAPSLKGVTMRFPKRGRRLDHLFSHATQVGFMDVPRYLAKR